MTVEFNPVGMACNLACTYCYEHPIRDAGNFGTDVPYDLVAVKRALEEEGQPFTLFGGEPLLMRESDLDKIWAWGAERFGYNGIQTNGVLLTDRHVEMMLRHRVTVGISVDGPGELNDHRWAGSLAKTRRQTEKSMMAIERLVNAGVPTSLIVTLHRGNAVGDRLERLKGWFRGLDALGVGHSRLHLLEVDHALVADSIALTENENIRALVELNNLEVRELERLRFDVFHDVRVLLLGIDEGYEGLGDGLFRCVSCGHEWSEMNEGVSPQHCPSCGHHGASCIWHACDPLTTAAVRGVDRDGTMSNCGRADKSGVTWRKASVAGYERQLALYNTPQEDGGCKGCRFFMMCKGECPGTGIDGDWRNRTINCAAWISIFESEERRMLSQGQVPLSVSPDRQSLEELMLAHWARGEMITIARARRLLGDGQTAASVSSAPAVRRGSGGHQDVPHGDEHGDHWDQVSKPTGWRRVLSVKEGRG